MKVPVLNTMREERAINLSSTFCKLCNCMQLMGGYLYNKHTERAAV